MKRARAIVIFLVLLSVLFIGSVGGGVYFYTKQQEKLKMVEQNYLFLQSKLGIMGRNIESLETRVKKNEGSLGLIKREIVSANSKRSEILAQLEKVRREIEKWKLVYKETLRRLGEIEGKVQSSGNTLLRRLDMLERQFSLLKGGVKSVELGEISIEKVKDNTGEKENIEEK